VYNRPQPTATCVGVDWLPSSMQWHVLAPLRLSTATASHVYRCHHVCAGGQVHIKTRGLYDINYHFVEEAKSIIAEDFLIFCSLAWQ